MIPQHINLFCTLSQAIISSILERSIEFCSDFCSIISKSDLKTHAAIPTANSIINIISNKKANYKLIKNSKQFHLNILCYLQHKASLETLESHHSTPVRQSKILWPQLQSARLEVLLLYLPKSGCIHGCLIKLGLRLLIFPDLISINKQFSLLFIHKSNKTS